MKLRKIIWWSFSRIRQMINFGTQNQPLDDQPGIRLINSFALLLNVNIVVLQIMTIPVVGLPLTYLGFSAFFFFLYTAILMLNALERRSWAKHLFVFGAYLIVFSLHFGSEAEVDSWICAIGIFSFFGVIFKRRKMLIVHSTIIILLVLSSIWISHANYAWHPPPFNQYEDDTIKVALKMMIFVITSVFVLISMISVRVNLTNHQKELTKLLEERSVLLKEIHHRVKNNLQVVSSLFNFQQRRIAKDNVEARNLIKSSQGRIQSMAMAHEELYKSENVKTVPVKSYLDNLVRHLYQMHLGGSDRVHLELKMEESHLTLETVIPIGLIVAEILSNVFKHAFPDGRTGKVVLKYIKSDVSHTLLIQDNGVGMIPESESNDRRKGIGLQLVHDLADQINARHTVKVDHGTTHTLTFEA